MRALLESGVDKIGPEIGASQSLSGNVMIGRTLGHYRVLEQLGQGGMGQVFAAEDTKLKRRVALKVLPTELAVSEERLGRFRREAESLAALNHPNIVHVYSVEESDQVYFLTMELVEGDRLSDRIPATGMPLEQLLELAIPLADALSEAHEQGIVHRDLKPSNIMVDRRGRPKILDFGLAKLGQPEPLEAASGIPTEVVTQEGAILGTFPYMSPEQVQGKPIDARSDLFSFGTVLYRMATGKRPFKGDNPVSLMSSILRDDPPSFDTINPESSPRLEGLLKRCLEKRTEARFQSAGELRQALIDLKTAPPSASPVPARPSIAVLPFTDMSPGGDQQYFCDGIAEEISTTLTKVPGLRVAARSSAFSLRGVEDIRKIGEILDTAAVLQGSVRTDGELLRITAELSDTRNGYQLWSERYDRDASDLFAVQDDIALAIAGELRGQLLGADRDAVVKRHTENREAYGLYLKGRYHWNRRYKGGLQKGMEFFQQSLQMDPEFALPHCGLADSFAILGFYNIQPPAVAFPKAKQAAKSALRLDETLADAHASLALVRGFFDWDWRGAEAAYSRALELSPDHPMANFWYAFLEMCLGRPRRSLHRIAEAQAADPLSLIINGSAGFLRYLSGDAERAVEEIDKVLEMDSSFGPGQWFLGLCQMELGRFDEAAQTLEKAVELLQNLPLAVATLGVALARGGRQEVAEQLLEKLISASKRNYVSPYYQAALCLALERREEALDWLTRAYNDRNNWLVFINVDPLFGGFRAEPEFGSFVARIGLDAELDVADSTWMSETEIFPD